MRETKARDKGRVFQHFVCYNVDISNIVIKQKTSRAIGQTSFELSLIEVECLVRHKQWAIHFLKHTVYDVTNRQYQDVKYQK